LSHFIATTVPERLIPLGEIVATHGLEGWLKLNPFNPETTALDSVRTVYIERQSARSAHWLEANRPHHRQILIKFHGINDIDTAQLFIGSQLSVSAESLPALERGEHYLFQAIGLVVFDMQGRRLGTVTGTQSAGGREIYVVSGAGKEYLIPAVKEIVEKIDFDAGHMIINPPDGLLDL
jgi:16S rRNA processing protein RimM